MAAATQTSESEARGAQADTQSARWVKYGFNVGASIIIAMLLAIAAIYLSQKFAYRHDTTLNRSHTLTPQTANILKEISSPVKIVSLYTQQNRSTSVDASETASYPQLVRDLLDEYHRKNQLVAVESIDPYAESAKLDDLFNEVAQKYGNDTKIYDRIINEFPKTVEAINGPAAAELKALADLQEPLKGVQDQNLLETMQDVSDTLQGLPAILQAIQARIEQERRLNSKTPNYKGIAEYMRAALGTVTGNIEQITTKFKTLKDDKNVPEAVRQYMAASLPRYEAIRKPADDLLDQMKKLGQLKQLDDLRRQKVDSVVVMGPHDLKVLSFDDIWPKTQRRGTAVPEQRTFAGEQQISTAIVTLTATKKPKVAIIRAAGPPLTLTFDQPAPLAAVAARLKQYNYDVVEKDVSGQWGMQSMQLRMQGYPIPDEPKDEEIADATWIVMSDQPALSRQGPNPLGGKLAEHLAQGGSALVLCGVESDPLEAAMKPWGVTVRTGAIAVHEPLPVGNEQVTDPLENAKRQQAVFILSNYGDHPLARPLNAVPVQGLFAPVALIDSSPVADCTTTALLPIPKSPLSWGTYALDKIRSQQQVNFSPSGKAPNTDIPWPIYGGVAVERIARPNSSATQPAQSSRLVVIGNTDFADTGLVMYPDPELRRHGIYAPLFPGNMDLFCNAVYWTSHMDSLIAISPNSMEVSRIEPMGNVLLLFCKIGVLIVGLPLAVLVCGAFIYVRRRD